MRLADIGRDRSADILAIINDAIVNTAAFWEYVPRPPESMVAWFDQKERGGYPVLGALDDADVLLGFATYGPFRDRAAYKYSVEHSVYTHRDHRGRGVGRALLSALLERAEQQGYHTVVGGIEASNVASIQLHRALGFVHCGTVRESGYKFDRWMDMAFYQKLLSGGPPSSA